MYMKEIVLWIDIVRVSEYNIHMADLAVDVQDDQSAKSFVGAVAQQPREKNRAFNHWEGGRKL